MKEGQAEGGHLTEEEWGVKKCQQCQERFKGGIEIHLRWVDNLDSNEVTDEAKERYNQKKQSFYQISELWYHYQFHSAQEVLNYWRSAKSQCHLEPSVKYSEDFSQVRVNPNV